MALNRTMGTLVARCQRRADKEGDDHVDTDEWKELIAEHYGELHGAVAKTGCRYFETEATISPDGSSTYALPSDHLSTVGVDYVLDAAGRRRELPELMVQERGLFLGQTGAAQMWAFTGTNIALYPVPSSGTYKHIYVPQPTDYSSVGNSTEIDVLNVHGEKFILWGVASVVLHKGSEDQLRAVRERDQALEQVVEWAVLRALTLPKRRVVRETDLTAWPPSPADWRFRWG